MSTSSTTSNALRFQVLFARSGAGAGSGSGSKTGDTQTSGCCGLDPDPDARPAA